MREKKSKLLGLQFLGCYDPHPAQFLNLHSEFLVRARYEHGVDRNAELYAEPLDEAWPESPLNDEQRYLDLGVEHVDKFHVL